MAIANGIGFIMFIGSLVMLILIHKRLTNWKKWYIVAPLAFLMSCGAMLTVVGSWASSAANGILGMFGGFGALIAGLLMIVAILVAYYDIRHDKKMDKPALAALILLPLLFTLSAGPIADTGGTLVGAFQHFGTSGVSYLVQG